MITFFSKDIKDLITKVIGVALAIYIIYSTFYTPPLVMMAHRALFACAILTMFFLTLKPLGQSTIAKTIDGIVILLTIIPCGYIILFYERILYAAGGAYLSNIEVYIGLVFIFVCLEAARRTGPQFFVICGVCLLYTFVGPYLPGILYHPGIVLYRIVYMVGYTSEGIFGVGISVGASLMFMFILFGSTMEATGVGDFFVRFANSIVGAFRGGSGKAAMVGSSLLGAIMGNATANVVVTGTFTIPLMVKAGFKRKVAAAIECYASEGGQYLPPVMGAAAFIMAQITRIPYSQIIIFALLPALLYYIIGFLFVDIEAAKTGLKGLPKSERESLTKLLKKQGHWLLPIIVVMYTIVVAKMTPLYAAMLGVLVTLLVTQLTPPIKITNIVKVTYDSFSTGSKNVSEMAGLLVGIGLVQQAFVITGLGGRIASILVGLAGGNLYIMVFIGFFAAILLGMGMPTPVAYLLVALFIAPGFVQLGVPIISAHLFLFYIAVKSASTPPVGTAAMISSNMAGANWWHTALQAMIFSSPSFIMAATFVFYPEIWTFQAETIQVILRITLIFLGMVGMVFSIQGYTFLGKLVRFETWILMAASLSIFLDNPAFNILGIIVALLIIIRSAFFKKLYVLKTSKTS